MHGRYRYQKKDDGENNPVHALNLGG